jgi:hypothetical protein
MVKVVRDGLDLLALEDSIAHLVEQIGSAISPLRHCRPALAGQVYPHLAPT